MLDELQAIHEDLVKGLKTSMHKYADMMRTKVRIKTLFESHLHNVIFCVWPFRWLVLSRYYIDRTLSAHERVYDVNFFRKTCNYVIARLSSARPQCNVLYSMYMYMYIHVHT